MRADSSLRHYSPAFVFFGALFWGVLVDPKVPVRPMAVANFSASAGPSVLFAVAMAVLIPAMAALIATLESPFRGWLEWFFRQTVDDRPSDAALERIGRSLGTDVHEGNKHLAVAAYVGSVVAGQSPVLARWFAERERTVTQSIRFAAALFFAGLAEIVVLVFVDRAGISARYAVDAGWLEWTYLWCLIWWLPIFLMCWRLYHNAQIAARDRAMMLNLLVVEPTVPADANPGKPATKPAAKKSPARPRKKA